MKTVWINYYKNEKVENIHWSKEKADENACDDRIACRQFQLTEVIDLSTKLRMKNIDFTGEKDTEIHGAWIDCSCLSEHGVFTVQELITVHQMSLDYYQRNIPKLLDKNLVEILDDCDGCKNTGVFITVVSCGSTTIERCDKCKSLDSDTTAIEKVKKLLYGDKP